MSSPPKTLKQIVQKKDINSIRVSGRRLDCFDGKYWTVCFDFCTAILGVITVWCAWGSSGMRVTGEYESGGDLIELTGMGDAVLVDAVCDGFFSLISDAFCFGTNSLSRNSRTIFLVHCHTAYTALLRTSCLHIHRSVRNPTLNP